MTDNAVNEAFDVPAGYLLFEFEETIGELRDVAKSTARYLSPSAPTVLDLRCRDLDSFSVRQIGSTHRWSTDRTGPIRTEVSHGQYQPDNEGHGRKILADINFVWEMTNAHTSREKTKGARSKYFILGGHISTKVWIREDDGTPLAMWRFEVGSVDSPGCHFHVQVLGDDEAQESFLSFPKEVDIPRLPSVLFSPSDVIEFVLGELFQDDWRKRAAHTSPEIDRWRRLQARRLGRLLRWKEQMLELAPGSPWAFLKTRRPPCDLLVDKPPKALHFS